MCGLSEIIAFRSRNAVPMDAERLPELLLRHAQFRPRGSQFLNYSAEYRLSLDELNVNGEDLKNRELRQNIPHGI